MLVVLEDALDDVELSALQQYFSVDENRDFHWLDSSYENIVAFKSPMAKLLQIAAKYVDISMMGGVEYWSHFNTMPNWHIDKDEAFYRRTNETSTPICSIVYYAKVDNLIGGNFLTETMQIRPKENTLIIFSAGMLHGVEPFEGTRMSVAINPWCTIPEQYRGSNA